MNYQLTLIKEHPIMNTSTKITEELLLQNKACKDTVRFAKNFNLLDLSLDELIIEGEFNNYVGCITRTECVITHVVEKKVIHLYKFNYNGDMITDPTDTKIAEVKDSNDCWEEDTHDSNGNKLTYKNSYGDWTEKTYDSNGNQLTYKDSIGSWTECTYDSNGNKLTFKNSLGFWSEYTYNLNGNRLTYKNSDSDWEERTYDSNGNLLTFKNNSGLGYTYRYDASDGYLVRVYRNDVLQLSIKLKPANVQRTFMDKVLSFLSIKLK